MHDGLSSIAACVWFSPEHYLASQFPPENSAFTRKWPMPNTFVHIRAQDVGVKIAA
ncbi:hypothetical protein [Acetobacter pasteurianus]|uniref:hypothetical protein n=1 Tax=Acetobacter pasteurianus TaxID=438 RepID=UPI00030E50F1|nr:hypothetical protein [Acetobacter pasteurianus]